MTAQRGHFRRPDEAHRHAWSDWYRVIFYRDSLGRLLPGVGLGVGLGRLGGAATPATDVGWTRACVICDTEEQW